MIDRTNISRAAWTVGVAVLAVSGVGDLGTVATAAPTDIISEISPAEPGQ